MYIYPINKDTITSYVNGFIVARKGNFKLTELIRNLLTSKYKIQYSNLGWVGQVEKFAEKLKINWENAFKIVTLEIIFNDSILDSEVVKLYKSRINTLIDRIEVGHLYFGEVWMDEWKTICLVKKKWFRNLWTNQEIKILSKIDKEIRNERIYKNKKKRIPTDILIECKIRFTETNKKLH